MLRERQVKSLIWRREAWRGKNCKEGERKKGTVSAAKKARPPASYAPRLPSLADIASHSVLLHARGLTGTTGYLVTHVPALTNEMLGASSYAPPPKLRV